MPNTQFGLLHLPPPCKLHALVDPTTKCTKLLSPLMRLPLLPLMMMLLLLTDP